MKFEKKHLGKWVAIKNEKVVATETTLKKLNKKVAHQKGVRVTLLPKGLIAG